MRGILPHTGIHAGHEILPPLSFPPPPPPPHKVVRMLPQRVAMLKEYNIH